MYIYIHTYIRYSASGVWSFDLLYIRNVRLFLQHNIITDFVTISYWFSASI